MLAPGFGKRSSGKQHFESFPAGNVEDLLIERYVSIDSSSPVLGWILPRLPAMPLSMQLVVVVPFAKNGQRYFGYVLGKTDTP